MTSGSRRRGLAAPVALPVGCTALLLIGGIAAGSHCALTASWVLGLAAVVVICGSFVAEPGVAPLLGAIGWFTVTGFSRPPYAQLQMTGRRVLPGRRRGRGDGAAARFVVHTVDCGCVRRATAPR